LTDGPALQDFVDLVAVVTGGASGIGLATTHVLAERGATVVALDVAEPPDGWSDGVHLWCDVTDDRSVRMAVAEVAHRFGGVDVAVVNAGIGAQGTVEDTPDDEWQHVLDVNVLGAMRTVRAVLPYLRASRCPAIVVTCSIASWAGLPRRAAYSVLVCTRPLSQGASSLLQAPRPAATSAAATQRDGMGRP